MILNKASIKASIIILACVLAAFTGWSQTTRQACVGQPITFTASGATTNINWTTDDGRIVNPACNNCSSITTPKTGSIDIIYDVAMGSETTNVTAVYNGTSHVTKVTVSATIQSSVSLVTNNNNFCPGTTVQFTATPTNGGTNPGYQFIVNGAVLQSGNSATYTTSALNNGDQVSVKLYPDFPGTVYCFSTAIPSNVITLTVKPIPVITNSSGQLSTTICSGAALNFTPTANLAGTGYNWTSSVSGPLTNVSASGGGAVADAPQNTGNVAGTVTYHITPLNNACHGTPVDYVVTVNPLPTVSTSPSSQTICSGQQTAISLSNANSVSGTSLNWTVSTASNVTGGGGGSGNSIAQNLSSADGKNQGVITYAVTGTAASCTGPATSVTVTVNPVPSISGPSAVTICSGSSSAIGLTNTNGTANTIFSWSVSPTNVTGATGGITSPVSSSYNLSQVLTNSSGITAGSVIYTITPISYSSCSGNPLTTTVSVSVPSNAGTPLASPFSLCHAGTISVSDLGIVSTSTQWQYRTSDDGGNTYTKWNIFSNSGSSPQNLSVTSGSVDRLYQLQVTAQNGVCAATNSSIFTATVKSNYTGTVSPSLVEAYGVATGSFTISGFAGSFIQWQQSTDGINWGDAAGTNNAPTYNYSNVITPTQYRAVISNGTCLTNSSTVNVNVYSVPSIQLTGSMVPALALGSTSTLQSGASYYHYQWIKDGTPISGATNSSYTAIEPGQYQLQVQATATASTTTTGNYVIYALGYQPDNTTNMDITTVIRKAGVSTATDLYTTLQATDYAQSIVYLDDLSRPTQSIAIGQSPLMKDLIQPLTYDTLQSVSWLPYAATVKDGMKKATALNNGGYVNSDQYLFYQQTNTKIANSAAPYAKSIYESSPLGRVTEQGAPGTDWQPGSHTIKPEFHTNVANDVRLWTVNGPSGYYAAGVLAVNKTTDENGNAVQAYTDKIGNAVLKRVQIDATIEGTALSWLETYYVYDTRGNVVLQVPPKAVQKLNTGTSWNNTFRDQWCFFYTYDVYGRVISKKVPGTDYVYYAYDPLNRLTLTQDGNLRALHKWAFAKYDINGRPVMTGLYTNGTQTDLTSVQGILNALYTGNSLWYEDRGTALHGYTNQSFPTTNADGSPLEITSVNYYDTYDFDYNGSDDYGYTAQGIAGEGAQGNSFGLATGSKKIILGTSTWLYTYQFYDRFGRVIQSQSNNHLSAAIDNLTTVVYDFEGKVLQAKTYQNAGGTNQTTVVKKMSYDFAGRLTKIYQNINGEANDQLVAQYNYNELGQVVEKNLHLLYDTQDGQTGAITADNIVATQYNNENTLVARSSIRLLPGYDKKASTTPYKAKITTVNETQAEANGRYLQSVDYRYNIRGWLNSINNAQLTADGVSNDDTNDYFGMELLYNTADAGIGNSAYYNGNIAATNWKSLGVAGAVDQRSYKYAYDKSDKLQAATFQANTGSGWTKETNTLNENLGYDANGNILTLVRNQNQRGLSGVTVTSTPQAIDNLTYTYATGNQMSKVEDGVATTIGAGDFKNGSSATTEYTYDTNGNVLTDLNKGISGVVYNVLGKAQQVTFTDGRTIVYAYDASGTKLSMATTVSGTTTTTNYVGGFVYTGTALNFFSSPEGRVWKNANGFEYQYSIGDHQGNTRVVFTSATPTAQPTKATFEASAQASEAANFQNYPGGSMINNVNTNNHTTGGTSSLYLNGGYAGMIGVARSYKVYPGDVVKIEAYGKYNAPSGTSSGLNNFATALLGAFALPTPAAGELGTPASGINAWGAVEAGGFADGSTDNTDTKAFVNIIVFDKNYNRLDVAYAQLVGSPGTYSYMTTNYTVKEAGYVYMYVSNENPTLTDVYFDDVTMTYTPGNVIQYNEYYPFGLQTAESWTRDNTTNNFLYNEGNELNNTSGWYETFFRGYDPALGRFHQIDPLADSYSSYTPYNYSANDPIGINDPTGAYWSKDMEESYTGIDYGTLKERMTHGSGFGDMDGGAGIAGDMWGDSYGWGYEGYGGGQYSSYADYQIAKEAGIGADKAINYIQQNYGMDLSGGKQFVSDINGEEVGRVILNNSVNIFYGKVQEIGLSLIISFITNSQKTENTNWINRRAYSLRGALDIIQGYKRKGIKIQNLVLFSHGARDKLSLKLGTDKLESRDFGLENEKSKTFYQILGEVNKNGNVAIIGCSAGLVIASAMDVDDVNLFMNKDLSRGSYNVIDNNGTLAEYFNMNRPLNNPSVEGWINVRDGKTYSNMIIYTSGIISPQK